jgi:hypothetical protein
MNVQGDGEGKGENFRIFPATSFSVFLLPVAADFCNGSHALSEPCASRNTLRTDSPFWATAGDRSFLPPLGLSRFMEGDSSASEPQEYGLTTVGIGSAGAQSITLTQQWVAGMATKTYFVGLFGLANTSLDLGAGRIPTFVDAFRTGMGLNATALSFSYTAGSYSRDVAPSLVLSGYDLTRFNPRTTLEVGISPSTTLPLAVGLVAISFGGSGRTWRDDGINSFGSVVVHIDSAIPHLWLPLSACKVFEEVFELQWNETAQLYLVNTTAHERQQQLNTTVTFSLYSSLYGKNKVSTFTLSYSSFNMKVTYPLVETESYYFPLKRASSPDQYTLGRVFLQETLISVNYDTASFNISQATYTKDAADVHPFLLSAPAQNDTVTSPGEPKTSQLSPGAYAGIGLGVCLLFLAMAMLMFAWRRKRWPFKGSSEAHDSDDTKDQYSKGELHGHAVERVEAMEKERAELEAKEPLQEMNSTDIPATHSTGLHDLHELEADSLLRTSAQQRSV